MKLPYAFDLTRDHSQQIQLAPDYHYADNYFDEDFAGWRETSPEEYAARHWLRFGACTLTQYNDFRDDTLRDWITRFEEIFRSPELLEECRDAHLTTEELAEQDHKLQRGGLP